MRYTVNQLVDDEATYVVDEKETDVAIYFTRSWIAAWLVAIWRSWTDG